MVTRNGPTDSAEYPLLMLIIFGICTLGFLSVIIPFFEIVVTILVVGAIVLGVLYKISHWAYDEYQFNKEMKEY